MRGLVGAESEPAAPRLRKRSAAPVRTKTCSAPSPPAWTKKHASQVWRSLEIDILPTLGPRPIDEIQQREIMALIKGIEDRGDRFEERTRMMQRWADYLDSVVKASAGAR